MEISAKCKNWMFQAEQQVHRQQQCPAAPQKMGDIAYITITLLIVFSNPITINSSMEGAPTTHTETERRHTNHTQHMC